jgi:hypothetical protein
MQFGLLAEARNLVWLRGHIPGTFAAASTVLSGVNPTLTLFLLPGHILGSEPGRWQRGCAGLTELRPPAWSALSMASRARLLASGPVGILSCPRLRDELGTRESA